MHLGGIRRVLLAVIVGCLTAGFFVATGVSALAATPPDGRVNRAVQDMFLNRLHVRGWAYDPSQPRAAVTVRVFVDGVYAGSARADLPSPRVDKARGLVGDHAYALTIPRARTAHWVGVRTPGVLSSAPAVSVGKRDVTRYYPPPGERIVDVARKYVGARYVEGGAGPGGFDCSGYTKYAYYTAHVKRLVHNAEGQRQSMRHILRDHARPGDLVFYMSGGYAYHVAIYAGHGWQYAAATVKDGVRYQPIWSSDVRFGTSWH